MVCHRRVDDRPVTEPHVPTWGVISHELARLQIAEQRAGVSPDPLGASPFDVVRRKYLAQLAEHTGRPVIVYASGWLEGRQVPDPSMDSVATRDLMGFMEAVHDLPPGDLDLIIHSPGGAPDAAETVMRYLRDQGFDHIRAIVPICAMSAATMMALSCDEIVLARHSHLGPIDPQFTISTPDGPRGAPAQAILDQFELAKDQCAINPRAMAAWLPILRSYLPGLLSECVTAQEATEEMVARALSEHMFREMPVEKRAPKAREVAKWFNDHARHRSHARSIGYDDAKAQGLHVKLLEDDDDLQERVLSAWHGVQLTFSGVPVTKLIENHLGKTWLLRGQEFIFAPQPQPSAPPQQRGPNRAERRRKH